MLSDETLLSHFIHLKVVICEEISTDTISSCHHFICVLVQQEGDPLVDVVVVVVIVVVVVGALLVVADHTIISCNVVVLRLTEAAVEFLWWVGWGLQSHFRTQPNNCVEVVLRCVVVEVVTKKPHLSLLERNSTSG